MNDAAGIVLTLVVWLLPIAVVAYVLRAIHTMILGMRSINVAVQRTADALERIEARGDDLP